MRGGVTEVLLGGNSWHCCLLPAFSKCTHGPATPPALFTVPTHPCPLFAPQAAVAARNKLLEEMVQEATTRPLPGAPEEIKRIDLREAGERKGRQEGQEGQWHRQGQAETGRERLGGRERRGQRDTEVFRETGHKTGRGRAPHACLQWRPLEPCFPRLCFPPCTSAT